MPQEISFQLFTLLDVLIATILCAAVGYERESAEKPAGLRTNMIVGGAACLIVSLTIPLVDFVQIKNVGDIIRTDPIRVLQALVVGVSFIGAGTILKKSEDVKGLTTAATLLFSLGIGISIALDQYYIAVGVTLLILIINRLMAKILDLN
ncbi:MgtC/SapB family protein [Mangrovivirga sp. M17]|uniref:MgtC/SapB family protein n=1 Tax=Mangrovivirga halotolerans TaxID=2993936 RepID=A0ABT3RV60_9BACT|nr:MgtC/SapB family protein [Mangrovivirga halotolerans]MCX2745132.1 MgtC/SapB family protein [Mangrovivirga halotolerans]